jgi:hypothetical protein
VGDEYRVLRIDGASPEVLAEMLTKAADQGFEWVDAISINTVSLAIMKRPRSGMPGTS